MIYIIRCLNICKWLFNEHLGLLFWFTCTLVSIINFNTTSTLWFMADTIAFIWCLLTVIQHPYIIPLHKDWRDFGKTKYFSEEEDFEEEEEEIDIEEEIEDVQEEFNEQISDRLDTLSNLLYFDEADAIDVIEEENFDGTTTFTLRYKKH